MRGLLILVCCALVVCALAGYVPVAASKTVEVHIDSACAIVYANGSSADSLALEIRDKVRWVNDSGRVVHIVFPTRELFGRPSIRLNKNAKPHVERVKSSAAGYRAFYRINCVDGTSLGIGNPKVVVGDD